MMYRDWREVTKILLNTKGSLSDARLPKSKLTRPQTKLYVKWVKAEIGKNHSQFQDFNKGKGIIATRERFLKWMETEEAKETVVDEEASASNVTFGKTIILPIAVPGVGERSILLQSRVPFSQNRRQNIHFCGSRTPLWFRTYSK